MRRWIFVVLTLALSQAALAVPVTWDFTGTVGATDVGGGSYWNELGISIGDQFSGSVTFDPDAAYAVAFKGPVPPSVGGGGTAIWSPNSNNPAFADFGPIVISRTGTGQGDFSYTTVNSIFRERTSLDTLFFAPIFAATNGMPIDTFSIEAFSDAAATRSMFFRLVAQPAGNGVIPDDRFLSTPPSLADLLFAVMSIGAPDTLGRNSVLSGLLTDVHRVPEPGTLSLLGAGLAGLAFLRRRRTA